eukprot:XP_010645072.1 PREDICTED: cytochrome P450 CYP72A219 [Vitis vinifera]
MSLLEVSSKVEMKLSSVAISFVFITLLIYAWRLLNWVWLRPKKLERCLRQQGLTGNSYRLLHGDFREMSRMINEANSRPISFSDDIVQRVLPFHDHSIQKYGKNNFIWLGPKPVVNIMQPELIRDVLLKHNAFQKPPPHPLGKLLASGISSLDGEQWTKRRKIINPAFHLEKLKHMVSAFQLSCSDMVNKWEKQLSLDGSCELDIWPYLQNLTGDVISRTAFGSSYEEGRRIFQLQKEQALLTVQVTRSVTMIFHEVLRLYPPAPMLTRAVFADSQVGGLYLPDGVQIALPILLIHHDDKIWGEDAKEFNPGRFSEGVSKAAKSQVSFFPFGYGPRICVGQNFAMMEAKMALAMILQRFSFELSPSYAHAPISLLTIQPQHGAHLILHGL